MKISNKNLKFAYQNIDHAYLRQRHGSKRGQFDTANQRIMKNCNSSSMKPTQYKN